MRASTRSVAVLLAAVACATVSAWVATVTWMRAKSGFSSASPVPMTLIVGWRGAEGLGQGRRGEGQGRKGGSDGEAHGETSFFKQKAPPEGGAWRARRMCATEPERRINGRSSPGSRAG